ncbi:hypothetical protein ACFO25_15270 [Paenactinomyces guangxiensis]|uniref:Uncharacterized protein n=1 Tax=Paenactinomyces guangxiensis TaxID=1490290 RepID=A0A7W2A8D6_9BACL|nr:hypothetical protein [Paenactinomyces guangxiensis]MBA4495511.1 hypothetical protein [Paenactinomyces guangxiensis]MBH8592769.1 hypothetical protein [Paenactinomyces guangxiensis]
MDHHGVESPSKSKKHQGSFSINEKPLTAQATTEESPADKKAVQIREPEETGR